MFARLVWIALVLAVGCDKPSHENLDKWTHTEQGPEKLKKALANEGIDPDLSAHAAANMVKTGRDPDVRAVLQTMTPARRVEVVGKLAPRLWEIARIEGDMLMPGPLQVSAKDALVMIYSYGDAAEKTQIGAYLTDWYCVASYEGRAAVGAVLGATVIRMIGASAGKKLMQVLDALIAEPGQGTKRKRIGDELMLAIAASGNPEGVKYLLDLVRLDRGDETLPLRAMSALYKAYVDSGGMFDKVEPAALIPHLDAIVAIAKDDKSPGAVADDAVALIRAAGPPACLPPLLTMIAHPHSNPRFKYVGADNALKCGGVPAIPQVVHALPDGPYDQADLGGTVVLDIAGMTPRDQVLTALRALLGEKSRLSQWVAIETLTAMKSVEDAPRIAAVQSKDVLVGFWGDQSDLDPKERKPDPTLGQRAKELAARVATPPK